MYRFHFQTRFSDPSSSDGLLFVKELVHTGTFFPKPNHKVTIAREQLDHWSATFARMREDGLDVPLYLGHIDPRDPLAPTRRLGTLEDVWVRENKDGIPALFGAIRFSSAEHIHTASNVSIATKRSLQGGNGKTYVHPLEHVAVTDAPVVPGLSSWESLSLALVDDSALSDAPSTSVHAMNKEQLIELAELLAVDVTDLDDEQLVAAVMGAVTAMIAKVAAAVPVVQEEVTQLEVAIEEQLDELPAEVSMALQNQKTQLASLTAANRRLQIEQLAATGRITPAQAQKLKQEYTDRATALSPELSLSFQSVVSFAEQLPARKTGSRTAVQNTHTSELLASLPAYNTGKGKTIPMDKLAAIHHFGTDTIPRRPIFVPPDAPTRMRLTKVTEYNIERLTKKLNQKYK